MDIIIVDKTVPSLEREKHKSFNWILTNDRFVKKEKKTSYSYRKDYYGFVPHPAYERKDSGTEKNIVWLTLKTFLKKLMQSILLTLMAYFLTTGTRG